MDSMRIGGTHLEYAVIGAGEPVVFIHGAFIADTFQPLLAKPSLIERYRCILYHRRGYAGSNRAHRPVSVVEQATDCRALLRHLGVDRAHVVGHSYGGAVALQLALDAPDMVHSLTLLEPALMVGASAPGYRASLLSSAERYREAGAAVVIDAFLEARCPGYRPLLDRVLPDAFAQAVADARTWFEDELPGLLDWRFDEEEARQISQPTLSVLGGESRTLSPRFEEAHRLLQSWLPVSEGYVVPGAAHLMTIQEPRALAEALAGFLGRHPLPSGPS